MKTDGDLNTLTWTKPYDSRIIWFRNQSAKQNNLELNSNLPIWDLVYDLLDVINRRMKTAELSRLSPSLSHMPTVKDIIKQ